MSFLVQHLPDSIGNFTHYNWFHNKGPNSHLFSLFLIDYFTESGAKYYWNIWTDLHELFSQIHTRHIGHCRVTHDKVDIIRLCPEIYPIFSAECKATG